MTTVTGSGAAPNGKVTARILVIDAASGARSLIAEFTTDVDGSGNWQLSNIADNAGIAAVAGTCWEIVCPTATGAPTRWVVTVPPSADGTPVPITSCTPVANPRPAIVGALNLVVDPAAKAVLVAIVRCLVAHGLAGNNTT